MSSIIKRNSCDKIENAPTPVRKIRPTRRSVSGQYAFRQQNAIPFESTLERDFLIRCEFQLSILDVIAQPVEIPFCSQNGREYAYTPDFLVYYRLGSRSHIDYPKPMLVEVKPKEQWEVHWRGWLTKWKAAHRYASIQGWKFRIYDESRIRDNALNNIRYLERFARMNFDSKDLEQILSTVSFMGISTVDYILTRHYAGIYKDKGLAHIFHLIAIRRLDCDISTPLSHTTELWVTSHDQ
jgi:hypothetical protein